MTERGKDQLVEMEGGHHLWMYYDSAQLATIGVGHCLDRRPISRRASEVIFEDDLGDIIRELDARLPWATTLSEPRYWVLVNMAFNMGVEGLVRRNPKALAAMERGDYLEAAREMLDGPWKRQVGQRAHRLARQMEGGEWS